MSARDARRWKMEQDEKFAADYYDPNEGRRCRHPRTLAWAVVFALATIGLLLLRCSV